MNEDLATLATKTLDLIERWQSGERDYDLATRLETQCTILKMFVGIQQFDELPAFCRALKQATSWLTDYWQSNDNRKARVNKIEH